MPEIALDLFQDTLVKDKLDYFRKKKRIEWLWVADLRLLNEEQELRDFIALALSKPGPYAVDTETTGLTKDDKIVGFSVAFKNDNKISAAYIPLYSDVDIVGIQPEKTLAICKELLEKPNIWKNYKFDFKVFKSVGINAQCLADISTMELCTKEGLDDITFNHLKNLSLKERYAEIFQEDMIELDEALGKGIYSFALAPLEMGKFYAATDAYATLRIYEYLLDKVDVNDFVYRLETMLLPVVANMEYEGVMMDTQVLNDAKILISKEQKEYEDRIYELAGEKLNLNSSPQLSTILYDRLSLKCMKTTPGGDKSTDKEALEMTLEAIDPKTVLENEIKGKEILETLFKYKDNEKLVNSFINNTMLQIASDGKVHPNYNTQGAISGRFSATKPAIQTLPKAEDGNKAILRKAFVSDPGTYFISADYSQVELKITASMSKDPNLQDAFMKGIDIHKRTASLMFDKKVEDVTKEDRQKAKTINFGLIYGLGAPGLSRQLGITVDEAKSLYKIYYSKMPLVKIWLDNIKHKIAETGLSLTHWGRKRLVPNAKLRIDWNDKSDEGKRNNQLAGEALRAGANHKVQGTSADITKIAMVRLDKAFKKNGLDNDVKMLVQVHDQVIFRVPESISPDSLVPIIKEAMELKVDNFVPLTVDVDFGYSWGGCITWKPGMTLDQIPYKNKVIISGDVMGRQETLKELFNTYTGENEVFLEVGGQIIQPERVDESTGEVMPQTVLASKKFIKEVEDLGLKVE
jgi:DNA polymerase I